MIRTYKCRAKLSGAGHERLGEIFRLSVELYNAGLESRIDCYRKTGGSRGLYDQYKELVQVRAGLPEFEAVSSIVFRGVLSRLDKAYKSFFRRVKGSNNRRKAVSLLAKEWQRLADRERNYLHRLTAELTRMYGFIAVEKLKTKNMLRNRHLAKSIQEQTWGRFMTLLNEKAESAGVKMVEVDPEGTSQECSACGATVKKDLSVRVHRCSCGLVMDRDMNAAINILHRGITIAGGNITRMVGGILCDKQDNGLARPRTVYEGVNLNT